MRTKYFYEEEATDGTPAVSGGSESSFAETAESTPAEPAETSTEAEVNWEGIAEGLDSDDNAVEGDEQVVEAAPAEETPEVPPAVPVVPPAPEAPVTPPVAAPAPVTPPVQAAPVAAPTEYPVWRANRLTELEQQYAINEEDATALLTEPETVLPKMAARMHMEVLESSMRAMQAMMPVMMQQVQEVTNTNNSAKTLFESVNPDLANPQYQNAIFELGATYRRVNATASPEEACRAIGALVRSALNLSGPAGNTPTVPTVQSPAAPRPFTPARGSGSGGNPVVAPSNPFEALAMEFGKEDD